MFKQIIVVLLLILNTSALADEPKGYPFLSFDQAMVQAKKMAKPVFVYFGRYGCGYCEKTNKEAFSQEEVKKVFTDNYILAYVDSESGKRLRLPSGEQITERELGARYKAFVTPIFSFMNEDGEVIHQKIGVQSKETLLKADKKAQLLLSKAKAQ
jgi:thioredoxin-related protein